MKKIKVHASQSYEVIIGKNILKDTGIFMAEVVKPCKVAVITDSTVNQLYGEELCSYVENAGFSVVKYIFPAGEQSKNMETLEDILEFLAENQLTRSDVILAFGGGVVGDISGFAASVYLRGIKFVQVPTTFLAAVDSSVGGKTAVNLKSGKNLAGAFHQPCLVVCDTETFKTLSDDTFADGVAETVKYGMITDLVLFGKMTEEWDIEEITTRCVEIKAKVVNEDEFDTGNRQLLNFGHTVGHAIEKCSGLLISHGHSVAMGMLIVTNASEKRGLCPEGTTEILRKTLEKCNLPIKCTYEAKELAEAAMGDKKRLGEEITLVVPEKIGKCVLKNINVAELEDFIAEGI